MFEYSPADIAAQIRVLPTPFFVWLRTLAIINLSSLLLVRRPQARWVLGAILFIFATNVPIFLSLGLVKAGSIPHLFVWVPLVLYLARELRSGRVVWRTPFGLWILAVLIVDWISVVFDVRDSVQYLLGDRAIVAVPEGGLELPIPTLFVIIVSLAAILAYALAFKKKDAATQ